MDYKERYERALKRAETAINIAADKDLVKGVTTTIFPELRESEDERIRNGIIKLLNSVTGDYLIDVTGISRESYLAYLEKQKEQNLIMAKSPQLKEQKPNPTEDMPYITDEHFYEREPVDSFRYKLAKYMTQNCRKEESPDGYTYHISAETILEMAKEELLKRGVVQKPAEWSEEDKEMIQDIIASIDTNIAASDFHEMENWLKSLRPSWKPSEGQMNALNFAITYFMHETSYKNPTELRDLYEQLKRLI